MADELRQQLGRFMGPNTEGQKRSMRNNLTDANTADLKRLAPIPFLRIRVRYRNGEITEQDFQRDLKPYGTLVRQAINVSLKYTEQSEDRISSVRVDTV